MERQITPETAQLYVSQHLRDAIESLELAQELTITSQIGDTDQIGISEVRLKLKRLLVTCNSSEGLKHFEKIGELSSLFTCIDKHLSL